MTVHDPASFALFGPVGSGQQIDIKVGEIWVRGKPWDKKRLLCRVDAITPGPGDHPRIIILEEMVTDGQRFYETDASLEILSDNGVFRPLSKDPMTAAGRGRASGLTLEPKDTWTWEEAKAWYADHVFRHPDYATSKPAIKRVMERLEGCPTGVKIPSPSTVLREIEKNVEDKWFDPVATAMPKSTVVPQPSAFGQLLEKLMQRAIFRSLRIGADCTEAYGTFVKVAKRLKAKTEDLPSLRTMQRRKELIPEYVRDYVELGAEKASRKHGSKMKRLLPDCPLHTVEVDDLQLDCEICDDVSFAPLGRPWLVMIRDRRTGVIIGFALTLGAPSFASFVEALRHAMQPKDMSAYPGLTWRYHGKFLFLVVDRATHFVGLSAEVAAKHLGFDIVELAPASPQLKGGLESANGYINEQVGHLAPGSVKGNVVDRKLHEDTRLGPMLTFSEIHYLVTHFICTRMNEMPKSDIGPVPGVKGVPGAIWNRLVGKIPRRPLLNPEIFDRLSGNRKSLKIQQKGITFDHVTYWSPILDEITLSGHHVKGDSYDCLRPWHTLAYIWVFADFLDEPLKVPVCSTDAGYATGIGVPMHELLKARGRVEVNEASAAKLLAKEFHATAELSAIVRGERDRHGVAEIVARIKRGDEQKRIASTVTIGTYSPAASADLLDMANPPVVPETEALSPHASPVHRPPLPGREGSVRQYRIEDGVVAEIDRGRIAEDVPPANPEPTDEELEADMARIAAMKRDKGWTR